MKLFLGNFEFEQMLGVAGKRSVSEKLRRINSELAAVLVLLADEGDLVWSPEQVDDAFSTHLVAAGLPRVRFTSRESEIPGGIELIPWGWTSATFDWGVRHQWESRAPDFTAVERVNSRRFSFELEREFEVGLAGAVEIQSVDELIVAIGQLPANSGGWVLKSEFSMSARERILGRSKELTEQAKNWTESRLAAGTRLYFEPWVVRISEIGMQFTILEAGAPVLDGITPLLCDAQGQYRGSRFADDASLQAEWSDAIAAGLKAAERAQAHGYFGPMGIDAMRYRDEAGNERVRPLQDINGRLTMGRVSLGLRRLLNTGEFGSWLHLRCPATSRDQAAHWYDELRATLPAGIRAVRTSPLVIGKFPVQHATLAIISGDITELLDAEKRLLNL